MEVLLSNEFVVLALDALLHLASVFALGLIVIIACKLLTRGLVDSKLLTGLTIAAALVMMRVLLMNNVHRVLGDFEVIVSMAAIGLLLFLTSLVLVYKLIAIPLLGTILSSLVIVAAQLVLAHYTAVLSLKLMPEGQRFAEYAGISNERTKRLMAHAENFQSETQNNLAGILKEALESMPFLSPEKEQETLSKDLASGVQSDQKQGADLENRYPLEKLNPDRPPDSSGSSQLGRGEKQFPQGTTSDSADYAALTGQLVPSAETTDKALTDLEYYLPINTFGDFPQPQTVNEPNIPETAIVEAAAQENAGDFFPESELSSSLTDDYVLWVPKSPAERSRWIEVANTIRIGAWFEGSGGENKGTVFIDGIAYRAGETIERTQQGERFLFRFEGVQEGQVIIRSLKRAVHKMAEAPDQTSED